MDTAMHRSCTFRSPQQEALPTRVRQPDTAAAEWLCRVFRCGGQQLSRSFSLHYMYLLIFCDSSLPLPSLTPPPRYAAWRRTERLPILR